MRTASQAAGLCCCLRQGAQRLHHLIRLGKLYEQEHGLKRGRQRLRQLAEEGRLYEQEHGLAPKRIRKRG